MCINNSNIKILNIVKRVGNPTYTTCLKKFSFGTALYNNITCLYIGIQFCSIFYSENVFGKYFSHSIDWFFVVKHHKSGNP